MRYITRHQLFIFILAVVIIIMDLNINNMKVIGLFLIGVSVITCVNVKENKILFFMMCTVALININVGLFNCIMDGYGAPNWQIYGMLTSEFNTIMAKAVLLHSTIVMFFTGKRWNYSESRNYEDEDIRPVGNMFIVIGGLMLLFLILGYGFLTEVVGRSSGYASVETPIYEYSCIVVAVVWYFSKKWDRSIQIGLGIYSLLFVLMFLSIGDRSSVVIIASLYFILYYRNNFSSFRLIIMFFIAIVILNIIGFTRNGFTGDIIAIIGQIISSGIYVDTVTYAYYTSITLCALNNYLNKPIIIAISYLENIFLGKSNEYTSLTIFARTHYSNLDNLGGGIYPAYFYAMGGYLGVIIGALLFSLVIYIFFSRRGKYAQLYQFLIAALTFRWYLYSFTTLYKGGVIFMSVTLGICVVFHRITMKK